MSVCPINWFELCTTIYHWFKQVAISKTTSHRSIIHSVNPEPTLYPGKPTNLRLDKLHNIYSNIVNRFGSKCLLYSSVHLYHPFLFEDSRMTCSEYNEKRRTVSFRDSCQWQGFLPNEHFSVRGVPVPGRRFQERVTKMEWKFSRHCSSPSRLV